MLIIDNGTAQHEELTNTGQTQSISLLGPELGEDLAYNDAFYSAPFATLHDDPLQPLQEVADGFYADLSTVRTIHKDLLPLRLSMACAVG